jgi:hypothetical protein
MRRPPSPLSAIICGAGQQRMTQPHTDCDVRDQCCRLFLLGRADACAFARGCIIHMAICHTLHRSAQVAPRGGTPTQRRRLIAL